jgi:hypothetical protein
VQHRFKKKCFFDKNSSYKYKYNVLVCRGPDLKTWPVFIVIIVCKTCVEEVAFFRLKERLIYKMDYKGTDMNWLRRGYTAKFLQ